MRIKKDGHLVEPLDLDVDAKSQKIPRKSKRDPNNHLGSVQDQSDPKDGNEGNLPSAMETSRKGKEKVTKSSYCPNVDTDVDIPAEERRTLKIGMMANLLEMDPPLSTPTRQTFGRGSNHILAGDTMKEVPPTSSKLPSDGIMEESVSQMKPMLSNILEHYGRVNQHLASLEEDLAYAKLEEKKLKATIEALEKEKSEMNAKVALMERKDLYDLLEAKMEGFQIANHLGTIGGFENLNLTITRKWVEIPMLNLEEFEKWHRTFQDEVDQTGIDVCYQSLLTTLKAATGTLPNSLVVFEYMRSIFDSYVNPTNDPNVLPLVKGLDADDFSVDKFFGLQDPTTPNDGQASPDLEEDLRTNERVRLRAEVRNLGAEPQWLTRCTRVRLEYEPTILPNVAPTDNPACPVTLDLTVDAREDPSSLPQSQIVPVLAFVDLTQYMSSPENEGSKDQGWPRKEDLTKEDLEFAMYKGCYLWGDVINMYINERFLKKPYEQLPNMFYMNTLWFTKASELVARYDKTNHAEEAMIRITRLRKSICPEFHDEDIFRGTHDPKAIFHVLRTVLCLIVPIDPALVMTGIMNIEQQQDGHLCEKHVLQMLVGAAKKESEGLDRCFRRRA
ncbi:hypothetical protein R1flu_009748 [Riccia fluitans]|uniref:Uncharacterized protein n=1 Tax=Riccia fluitans TaxID=41844 RepID=A0ABD1Z312_9MARC